MALTASLSDFSNEDWVRLGRAVPSEYAFTSFGWYPAWAAHLVPSGSWRGRLSCAAVRHDRDGIVGVFPYAWQTIGPLKFISLGGPYGPLRTIPLGTSSIRDASAALATFFSARRRACGLRLGPVESTDPAVTAFLGELRDLGWRLYRIRESLEYTMPVPESFAAYEDQVGTGLIKKSAYKERRMARRGKVVVRCLSGLDPAGWDRAMSDVDAIEQRSWVGVDGGRLRFAGAANRAFWRDFLADPRASDATKVWLLYFDGKAVSHCFAIDSGPVRYIITNAYMKEVANYSTGVILLRYVVEDAIGRHMSLINYGEGDAGYKSRWGFSPERQLRDWVALPPGLRGAALGLGLKAKDMFSRLWQRKGAQTDPSPEADDQAGD
jgi:hypothetical protein